jgi:hypothetical protein
VFVPFRTELETNRTRFPSLSPGSSPVPSAAPQPGARLARPLSHRRSEHSARASSFRTCRSVKGRTPPSGEGRSHRVPASRAKREFGWPSAKYRCASRAPRRLPGRFGEAGLARVMLSFASAGLVSMDGKLGEPGRRRRPPVLAGHRLNRWLNRLLHPAIVLLPRIPDLHDPHAVLR